MYARKFLIVGAVLSFGSAVAGEVGSGRDNDIPDQQDPVTEQAGDDHLIQKIIDLLTKDDE